LIIEILVLGLASTVRPTSLAVVSALLPHAARRRLLLAYIVGGLIFTIAFGVVVVGAFHGIRIGAGSSRTKGIAEIIGGVIALVFAFAVLAGLVPRRAGRAAPRGSAWKARLDRGLTVPAAAVAGPLTHIPGLFYLVALNVIVAAEPRVPGGLLAIAIYNAIWFTVPIAALATCIVNPDAARNAVARIQRWTGEHSRALLLYTSFTVGVVLVVRGALLLA